MRNLLILMSFLFASESLYAVCVSPISRTNIGLNAILSSARYNSELNTVFNRANNLPGDCITNGTVTAAKLASNSVTTSKIVDGAVTLAKLAPGSLPEAGKLLRVSSFSSSGTWTKQSDVGAILVQVVGGGGASYHASATNGGNSSFGSHCLANGGARPAAATTAGGSGGTATNGDINLVGGNGEISTSTNGYYYGGSPGYSVLGDYGRGGVGSIPSNPSGGGGAGAYCSKLIDDGDLAATETVTVGAGGTNPGTNTTPGKAGLVIVYEYSK